MATVPSTCILAILAAFALQRHSATIRRPIVLTPSTPPLFNLRPPSKGHCRFFQGYRHLTHSPFKTAKFLKGIEETGQP